jgi:DNA polymerase-4
MDAFFAAIEQLDQPELRGKPVIVGALPDRRGVVSTCSYEVRPFGVHSAMPSRTAAKLCPHGIFVPPRMGRYEEVSGVIMDVFREFTPLVEPLSLDEAFLDVAGALGIWADSVTIARELKRRVREQTRGLTASVGVASNKFLAKVASDMNKPDGLTVVPEDEAGVLAFLGRLPVTKLWGIGKVSGERLHRAGIRTIAQLQMMDTAALAQYFGVAGAKDIWALCRGIDDRPVVTEWAEKSVSGEHTFDQDCAEIERVRQVLLEQVERVGRRLRSAGKAGKIVQIKVRFSDFRTITRQVSLPVPIDSDRLLRDAAYALLDRENIHRPVRLIGVGVTGLAEGAGEVGQGQLLLPDLNPVWQDGRNAALDRAVDALRETFGKGAIKRGNWKKPLD